MIAVSNTQADANGHVILRNYQNSGEYNSTARIQRSKTLDGGGLLSPYGTSPTDRDFIVDCRLTKSEQAILKALHENCTLVRISFWEGSFTGYIHDADIQRNGTAKITFWFQEKLT
jgi:hypothetical protein